MNKNIGFIGCGNMAQAMIGGIIKSKFSSSKSVIASNPSEGKLKLTSDKYGINITSDNVKSAEFSDVLVLAVKPIKYESVINEIKGSIKDDVIIVSIAPGISISDIESCFENKLKVVRAMPNTPALVGEGMSAISFSDTVDEAERKYIVDLFNSFGKTEVIEERLMDAVPAISGSSPAYVYMFIEALADGGVLDGIPRDKAYKMAAQAVLGAAKMVLETGKHPGSLKDEVCSPGGTTIEAVYTLEKCGFRSAVISAMRSCTEKSLGINKK